jgi:hypothetical protein
MKNSMNPARGGMLAAGRMKNMLPASPLVHSGTMKNSVPEADWHSGE